MPSDLEARIVRLEQLVYPLPRLVAKEAARSGTNAQNVTRLRASNDGAPNPGVLVSVCGGILPTTLYVNVDVGLLNGGGRQPIVWDPASLLWLGCYLFSGSAGTVTNCSTSPSSSSAPTALVLQLSQALQLSGYMERCPAGTTWASVWVAGNSCPATLTGSSQFGANTFSAWPGQPTSASTLVCSPFELDFRTSYRVASTFTTYVYDSP